MFRLTSSAAAFVGLCALAAAPAPSSASPGAPPSAGTGPVATLAQPPPPLRVRARATLRVRRLDREWRAGVACVVPYAGLQAVGLVAEVTELEASDDLHPSALAHLRRQARRRRVPAMFHHYEVPGLYEWLKARLRPLGLGAREAITLRGEWRVFVNAPDHPEAPGQVRNSVFVATLGESPSGSWSPEAQKGAAKTSARSMASPGS